MINELTETVAEIRALHRRRVFGMDMRKVVDLKVGAFLRTALGWRKDLPAAERKVISDRAAELIKIGEKVLKEQRKPEEKRKPVEGADNPEFLDYASVITGSILSREPFDKLEAEASKRLTVLAETLPVWPWCSEIRGFGHLSLAAIVGEAGDLALYDGPAKLWKRLGLAVLPGADGSPIRQGGLRRAGLSDQQWKDLWKEHGYNQERRSRMWNIGKAMIYAGGDYADLYRQRKEYERAKAEAEGLTVKPAGEIRVGERDKCRSLGHIDRRAQRYMEKRVVRDLWRAWRAAGGREANLSVSPMKGVPSAPTYTELAAE